MKRLRQRHPSSPAPAPVFSAQRVVTEFAFSRLGVLVRALISSMRIAGFYA
jgi:hypothetical protein